MSDKAVEQQEDLTIVNVEKGAKVPLEVKEGYDHVIVLHAKRKDVKADTSVVVHFSRPSDDDPEGKPEERKFEVKFEGEEEEVKIDQTYATEEQVSFEAVGGDIEVHAQLSVYDVGGGEEEEEEEAKE